MSPGSTSGARNLEPDNVGPNVMQNWPFSSLLMAGRALPVLVAPTGWPDCVNLGGPR